MSEPCPRRFSRSPDSVEVAFAGIRADRRRGAHALAEAAIGTLGRLLDRWSDAKERPTRRAVRRVARVLETAQPAMGPFLRWAAEWRRMERGVSSEAFLRTARAWAQEESARLRSEEGGIARTARKSYPRSARHIVTISRSRSVLRALATLTSAQRPEKISVLESLPGGEGRRFSRELRQAGLSARTVPDSAASKVVGAADLLMIGADAVFADGSVAHKVGTKALAKAAFRHGIPVVVVAGRSKFTERPAPRGRLPPLFDRTPSRYITEFWTDEGVRPAGGTHPRASGPVPL